MTDPTSENIIAVIDEQPSSISARQRILHILRFFFVSMIGAYGLSSTLLAIAWNIIGDSVMFIALPMTFASILWIPAIILLPVVILMRSGQLTALIVVPALIWLSLYGGQFLPRTISIDETADTLSIFTYNIHARINNHEGIFEQIEWADADIVALQEISFATAELLEETFSDTYPYQALYPAGQATDGQALLSRYPIIEVAYFQFDGLPVQLGHMRAVLEIGEQQIVVYNVHPTHPGMSGSFFNTRVRQQEVHLIMERVNQEELPVLLAGDFNMPDTASEYILITETLQDAYRSVGWGMGWTFPQRTNIQNSTISGLEQFPLFPFIRLDYIFYSDLFTVSSAQVAPLAGGSDHHGVKAVFNLTEHNK